MNQNNDSHLHETLIESQPVFKGNFIQVIKDTVRLPDGKTATREWAKHGGAVVIIALNEQNEIIIERQYRHPVKRVMLELPAGKLEASEEPLTAAKRELQEETGYTASSWTKLGTCLPCIGYSNEEMHYFLATGLTLGSRSLDEGEFLDVITYPTEKCLQMAYSNQLTDSKTLAGLMLYVGYLNSKTK